MLENGVLMCEIKRSILDKCNMPAAIRICVTAGHTEEDLVQASSALRKVVEEVLHS
jgi:serine palmitoyltransferase